MLPKKFGPIGHCQGGQPGTNNFCTFTGIKNPVNPSAIVRYSAPVHLLISIFIIFHRSFRLGHSFVVNHINKSPCKQFLDMILLIHKRMAYPNRTMEYNKNGNGQDGGTIPSTRSCFL